MKLLVLLSSVLTIVLFIECTNKTSGDQTGMDTGLEESSGNSLEGTWKLMSAKWAEAEMEEEGEVALKIFSQNRFFVIRYSMETDEFIGASGGSYIQLGEEFTEYPEYNTWDTTLVNYPQKFSFEFKDNLLYQRGLIKAGQEPEHTLEEVYERLEPGISGLKNKDPIVGVWKLDRWANGDRVAPEPLPSNEQVYKIITPSHYYVVRYDKNSGHAFGVSVGKHHITADYYVETIDFYTYDPSNNGKQYTFNYEFKGDQFIQTGIIDSEGGYMNYKIEEYYSRVQ